MSWIRTWLKCWRWPIVRRYCFLRLYFNTRTLAVRSWVRIFPLTLAFSTSGAPTVSFSVRTTNTWLNSTVEPGSPATRSTRITSPGEALYCFPPVRKIAYIDFYSPVSRKQPLYESRRETVNQMSDVVVGRLGISPAQENSQAEEV